MFQNNKIIWHFFQIAYTQRNVFTKRKESKQNTQIQRKHLIKKNNKVNVIFGIAFHWPELHN